VTVKAPNFGQPHPLPHWFDPWREWRNKPNRQKGTRPKGIPKDLSSKRYQWAWKLRAWLNSQEAPHKQPDPHDSPHDFWYETPPFFVATMVNAPPETLREALQPYGFRLVFGEGVIGAERRWQTNGLRDWADAVEGWGGIPGGYSWNTCEDPATEAALIKECVDNTGVHAWYIDGEKEAEQSGRSGELADRVRALLGPDFPIGWTTEPQLALDHGAIRRNRIVYSQQAYPRGAIGWGNGYDLAGCVGVATAQGYRPQDIVPLAEAYTPYDNSGVVMARVPPQEYGQQARAAGVRQVGVYTPEQSFDVGGAWWKELQPWL
jgi:hypothetical protein